MAVRKCLRFTLIIVNLLLLTACAGLIYFGVRLLREYSHYSNVIPKVYMIGLPAGILFFVGSLLFLVALVGVLATCTEAKCLIATYCTLHLITFVLLIAATGLLFACKHTVADDLEKNLANGLKLYFLDRNFTHEIDYIQLSNKCCGVNNYADWTGTPWFKSLTHGNDSYPYPESCCPHSNCTTAFDMYAVAEYIATETSNNTDFTHEGGYNITTPTEAFINIDNTTTNVFTMGCHQALAKMLRSEYVISSLVATSVTGLLIAAFAAICGLYHCRRPDYEFIGLVEEDAVRV